MAPRAPSLRENAPASSSSHTSRNPSAPPKSVAASAFFLPLTPYPLRLWIGEFFRASLGAPVIPFWVCSRRFRFFRYVHDRFPGWIGCALIDGEGHRHSLLEKVPIVIDEWRIISCC